MAIGRFSASALPPDELAATVQTKQIPRGLKSARDDKNYRFVRHDCSRALTRVFAKASPDICCPCRDSGHSETLTQR